MQIKYRLGVNFVLFAFTQVFCTYSVIRHFFLVRLSPIRKSRIVLCHCLVHYFMLIDEFILMIPIFLLYQFFFVSSNSPVILPLVSFIYISSFIWVVEYSTVDRVLSADLHLTLCLKSKYWLQSWFWLEFYSCLILRSVNLLQLYNIFIISLSFFRPRISWVESLV